MSGKASVTVFYTVVLLCLRRSTYTLQRRGISFIWNMLLLSIFAVYQEAYRAHTET